jgi:hypothetical protein
MYVMITFVKLPHRYLKNFDFILQNKKRVYSDTVRLKIFIFKFHCDKLKLPLCLKIKPIRHRGLGSNIPRIPDLDCRQRPSSASATGREPSIPLDRKLGGSHSTKKPGRDRTTAQSLYRHLSDDKFNLQPWSETCQNLESAYWKFLYSSIHDNSS